MRKRYFESPLESIVDQDGIPVFVKVCVSIVEKTGLDSEGLYRVSGKREDIMLLQEKFDQGMLPVIHVHVPIHHQSVL